jgi:hypothetical protein
VATPEDFGKGKVISIEYNRFNCFHAGNKDDNEVVMKWRKGIGNNILRK